MRAPRVRFARQMLALQIGVVTLVVGVGFTLIGWLLDTELTKQYEQRALAVARTVAADAVIGNAAARHDPEHVVQARAEAVRARTGALFVVVTDRTGLRLSHPNPDLLGQPVSTDPSAALSGREVVIVERGTLGRSARAKVPLRDGTGAVVGEVSVGFATDEIRGEVVQRLGLGLEPHELAELVQEREAVLHGIGEGVLAVDAAGRVSVCNGEASRLLGVEVAPGTPVAELDLPPRLRAALDADSPADNVIALAGERVLVANYRGVRRDGRDLGGVLTLRDRTDLETLTRELDSVRALTKALRAQRHEFANRLHTIAGLLQIGHHREAVEYLHTLSTGSVTALGPGTDAVKDPYLQAFVAAKTAEAAEKGVRLELGETSWVPGRVVAPVEVTTVVGNLVDNALEAARLGARRPAWVELSLLADGDTLHVSVLDSGDGVPDELREEIFQAGVSTRDGDDHGLGLALAQHAARARGGQIRLADTGSAADAGSAGHGAVFVARLPAALGDGPGPSAMEGDP